MAPPEPDMVNPLARVRLSRVRLELWAISICVLLPPLMVMVPPEGPRLFPLMWSVVFRMLGRVSLRSMVFCESGGKENVMVALEVEVMT